MKSKTTLFVLITIGLYACSGGGAEKESKKETFNASEVYGESGGKTEEAKAADEAKGIGKFTHVELGATLDKSLADKGLKVYELKCSACHRLTDEKLVGPGWKGVTSRRTAEWVMNFSTNVDEMLEKDLAAQTMLEECLVRMPNQNLTDEDARNVYEFMRGNDGLK